MFYMYSEMRRIDARANGMTAHMSAQLVKMQQRIEEIEGETAAARLSGMDGIPGQDGLARLQALIPMLFENTIVEEEEEEDYADDEDDCDDADGKE
jgi:hypothetical protein